MNNKTLTKVALRYRAVFLDINREDIDMRSEATAPVMAFVTRLKENGFYVSEQLLHALNAVSADRLAEITECINDVMGVRCLAVTSFLKEPSPWSATTVARSAARRSRQPTLFIRGRPAN